MVSKSRDRISWAETRKRLRQDGERVRLFLKSRFGYSPISWWLDPSYVSVLLHRLSHYCWQRNWMKAGRLLGQINIFVTGADIHPASDIQGGLLIASTTAVNISSRIGRNATFMPLTGTGDSLKGGDIGAGTGLPVLDDNIVVNSFAGIQGAIRVGSNVCVMPGAKISGLSVRPDSIVELATRPGKGSPINQSCKATSCDRLCEHGSLVASLNDLRGDVDRYLEKLFEYNPGRKNIIKIISALLTNQLIAISLYRLSHFLYARGWRRLSFIFCWLNILLNKTTIHPGSCIGKRLFMPHSVGVVFCGRAGSDLSLYVNSICVPYGGALTARICEAPNLGDRVILSGQASVIGPVFVADDTLIAPKVQLTENTDRNTHVYTDMARSRIRPNTAVQEVQYEVDA